MEDIANQTSAYWTKIRKQLLMSGVVGIRSPNRRFLRIFFCFRLIPFIIFAHLLLCLLPIRNSDPGSHSRLFYPLPATVRAFIFIARSIYI